jgi:hypothetical protein
VGFRQVFGHVSHLVDGLSRLKHWALGAVIAALCSFAFAKAPHMSHGGGGYSRAPAGYSTAYPHAAAGYAAPHSGLHKSGYSDGYAYGAANGKSARSNVAEAQAHLPRGGGRAAVGNYGNDFDDHNRGMRRVAGPVGYPNEGRGGVQYAGAITPVSAESRAVPRPPANAPVRAGSIRADVARYNEERGSSRVMQRQSDDPRQQEVSPYRN